MSKTKIAAGDSLTVGDLTDDHLGAVIEVGPIEGITYRFRLDRVSHYESTVVTMLTKESGVKCTRRHVPVTVVTPPPVVQPDEPTVLGQCIHIENKPGWRAMVMSPGDPLPIHYRAMNRAWFACTWTEVLEDAGGRQIIVSDPPRWPDETPEVPERIEVGEWPNDDTHLREWEWIDADGDTWHWYDAPDHDDEAGWSWFGQGTRCHKPFCGPWICGERVE